MSVLRRMRPRSTRPTTRTGCRAVPARHQGPEQAAVGRLHAQRLNEEELKRLTKEQLVTLARHEELPHRSKMNKAQLARTLRRHYRRAAK